MRQSGAVQQRGQIDMNNNKIVGLLDGTNPSDAVNLQQVQNLFVPGTAPVKQTINYERGLTQIGTGGPYMALGNGQSNSIGGYVVRDGIIDKISISFQDMSAVDIDVELRVNDIAVATFPNSSADFNNNPNVSVVEGDTVQVFLVDNGSTASGLQPAINAQVEITYNVTLDGLQGPQGDPGVDGIPGSQLYTGSGLPSNSLGIDGDYYTDIVTGDWYQKSGGTRSFLYNPTLGSPGNLTQTIVYTCERNGTSTGPYARGNGASNNFGGYIPFDGIIIAVALVDEGSSPSGAVFALDVNQAQVATFNQTGNSTIENLSINVSEGDYVTFNCISSGSGGSNRVATIVYQYDTAILGLKGEQGDPGLNGGTTVSGSSLPVDATGFPSGTIFRVTTGTKVSPDGDEYIGDGSTWTFLGNVIGSPGSGSQIDYLKVIFNNSNTMNSSSETALASFQTTAEIESSPGLFTLVSTGVTITQPGFYEIRSSLFFTTSAQRSNVAVRISVNGVSQAVTAANNYIRAASGHNESSSIIMNQLNLTPGDIVGINTQQLAAGGTVNLDGSQSVFYIKKIG